MSHEAIEAALGALEGTPGIRWGVSISVGKGSPMENEGAHEPLRSASMGKVLLLLALAEQIESGRTDPAERLHRGGVEPVADSGLWQHLSQEDLSVRDVAALIGSVSDNLATNVLIERIGLEAAAEAGRQLELRETRLLDRVRDQRGANDPRCVSESSASELRRLFAWLREPSGPLAEAARLTVDWLRPGADLSMVASAWHLDPLAHVEPDRGVTVVNKTGTNSGVRADAGFVEAPAGWASYAVVANFERGDARGGALEAMRRIGSAIRFATS